MARGKATKNLKAQEEAQRAHEAKQSQLPQPIRRSPRKRKEYGIPESMLHNLENSPNSVVEGVEKMEKKDDSIFFFGWKEDLLIFMLISTFLAYDGVNVVKKLLADILQ